MEIKLFKKLIVLLIILPVLIIILLSSCEISFDSMTVSEEPGFKYKNTKIYPVKKLKPMEVALMNTEGRKDANGKANIDDIYDYKVNNTIKEMKAYIKTIDENGNWKKTALEKLPKKVMTDDLIKEEITDKENRFVITYNEDGKVIALTTVFNNNKGSGTYLIDYGRIENVMGPMMRNDGVSKIQKDKFIPLSLSPSIYKKELKYEKYNTKKYLNYLLKHPKIAKKNFGNCYMIGVEFS